MLISQYEPNNLHFEFYYLQLSINILQKPCRWLNLTFFETCVQVLSRLLVVILTEFSFIHVCKCGQIQDTFLLNVTVHKLARVGGLLIYRKLDTLSFSESFFQALFRRVQNISNLCYITDIKKLCKEMFNRKGKKIHMIFNVKYTSTFKVKHLNILIIVIVT